VAIVTGQQAGLFGGPLYTLLKAITALKLAQQVSRDHGVDAVAVFWIEAEDHDWDEVRSCTVLDESLTPRTIALPTRSADPVPVATIQFDDSLERAIAELESVLPPTEFRQSVIDDLRDSYASGRGVADAFGRWLERTLGDRGLVVYDASDPAAKPFVADLFARELSTPGETAKLAAAAGADLTARGYHAQHRRKKRFHDPTSCRVKTPSSMPRKKPTKARQGDLARGHRRMTGPALKTPRGLRIYGPPARHQRSCHAGGGLQQRRIDGLVTPTTSAVEVE